MRRPIRLFRTVTSARASSIRLASEQGPAVVPATVRPALSTMALLPAMWGMTLVADGASALRSSRIRMPAGRRTTQAGERAGQKPGNKPQTRPAAAGEERRIRALASRLRVSLRSRCRRASLPTSNARPGHGPGHGPEKTGIRPQRRERAASRPDQQRT
jgi:hypothetical protein